VEKTTKPAERHGRPEGRAFRTRSVASWQKMAIMPIIPILAMTTLSVVRPAAETGAPKIEACLSDRDMREEIEEHHVVQPIVAFRAAGTGEKIRAKLCKTETGLVYLITALGHDGQVSRVIVDAVSGLRVGAR
jgi:hypothetical protein